MELPFKSFFERAKRWPRWMQIAAIGGALLVGWWVCEDTVWSVASNYSRQADDLRRLLGRGRAQVNEDLRSVQDSVVAHGRVLPPRSNAEGSWGLGDAATRVIGKHLPGMSFKFDPRSGGMMPPSVLRGVVGAGQRVERVQGEIEFEASPDLVSKIIADFEASPEVDAIASLRLTRIDASRKLKVKLVIEAWVVGSGGRGRSAA